MNAELPRRVGCGRHNTTGVGSPTDDYWLAFKGGIEKLLHADKERVHVDVEVGFHYKPSHPL